MIPGAAIEAAAKVMQASDVREGFGDYPLWEYTEDATAILEAAAPHLLADATKLIRDLTDPDACQFDHHGGCQAHGYLSLEQGETCPQADAKEWAAHGDN